MRRLSHHYSDQIFRRILRLSIFANRKTKVNVFTTYAPTFCHLSISGAPEHPLSNQNAQLGNAPLWLVKSSESWCSNASEKHTYMAETFILINQSVSCYSRSSFDIISLNETQKRTYCTIRTSQLELPTSTLGWPRLWQSTTIS